MPAAGSARPARQPREPSGRRSRRQAGRGPFTGMREARSRPRGPGSARAPTLRSVAHGGAARGTPLGTWNPSAIDPVSSPLRRCGALRRRGRRRHGTSVAPLRRRRGDRLALLRRLQPTRSARRAVHPSAAPRRVAIRSRADRGLAARDPRPARFGPWGALGGDAPLCRRRGARARGCLVGGGPPRCCSRRRRGLPPRAELPGRGARPGMEPLPRGGDAPPDARDGLVRGGGRPPLDARPRGRGQRRRPVSSHLRHACAARRLRRPTLGRVAGARGRDPSPPVVDPRRRGSGGGAVDRTVAPAAHEPPRQHGGPPLPVRRTPGRIQAGPAGVGRLRQAIAALVACRATPGERRRDAGGLLPGGASPVLRSRGGGPRDRGGRVPRGPAPRPAAGVLGRLGVPVGGARDDLEHRPTASGPAAPARLPRRHLVARRHGGVDDARVLDDRRRRGHHPSVVALGKARRSPGSLEPRSRTRPGCDRGGAPRPRRGRGRRGCIVGHIQPVSDRGAPAHLRARAVGGPGGASGRALHPQLRWPPPAGDRRLLARRGSRLPSARRWTGRPLQARLATDRVPRPPGPRFGDPRAADPARRRPLGDHLCERCPMSHASPRPGSAGSAGAVPTDGSARGARDPWRAPRRGGELVHSVGGPPKRAQATATTRRTGRGGRGGSRAAHRGPRHGSRR